MSLIKELNRRNVIKVAIAYIVMAWLVIQVADVILSNIEAPNWVFQVILLLLGIGFLLTLFFSWAFEITPEGLKREHKVDRSQSIAPQTGKRLNNLIVAFMALALAYFIYDKFVQSESRDAALVEAATKAISEQAITGEIPAEPVKSIAVLPFANRSANPDDAFFVDGIHDDLLTYIAQIGTIKTISRTSVMQYRDSTKPIPEIARELGVATVLEGGVQRAGEQVRINVQLIDAQTDDHLWSQIYDRELTAANVFSIQSEIAGAIADALRANLTPENTDRMKNIPTRSLVALEAFYLGRQQMGKRTVESLSRAVDHFSDAVTHDPDFALAHVGLADTYWLQVIYSNLPEVEMRARSKASVERALELDPMLGEVQTALANLRRWEDDTEGAEAAFQRALQLNPNYATAYQWYGELLGMRTNRLTEALELSRKAVTLDPLSTIIRLDYAAVLERAGRFDEALVQIQKAVEIDPGFPLSYRHLGSIYQEAYGRLDERVFSFQKSNAIEPDRPWNLGSLAHSYRDLGGDREANFWSRRYIKLWPDNAGANQSLAMLHLFRGEQASSMEFAHKALAIRPRWGWALTLVTNHDLNTGSFVEARTRYEEIYPEWFDGSEPEINRPRDARAAVRLAAVLIETGEKEKAEQWLDKASSFIGTHPRLGRFGYGIIDVQIHTLRNDKEQALSALRQAVDQGWRRYWRIILEHDPILQPLHGEPRFQAMKEEIEADMAEQLSRVREWETNLDLMPAEATEIESY